MSPRSGIVAVSLALALALTLASAMAGCGSADGPGAPASTAGATATTAATTTVVTTTTTGVAVESVVDAACAGTVGRPRRVTVRARGVVEASGLAVSRNHDGVLWVHNDSGDTARVFALGDDGRRLGTFRLSGAEAVDWEDLAVGPVVSGGEVSGGEVSGGEVSGGDDALYLADIGDNGAVRDEVTVYRVPEPVVSAGAPPVRADLDGVESYSFAYPDGPRDAEALFIDRTTDSFYVIEKSLGGGVVGIYRGSLGDGWAAAGEPAPGSASVERVGTLTLGAGPANAVTGADMTPAGDAIAVRTYGGVLLWDRPSEADVAEVLAGEPCNGPLPAEVQGEAVALAPDASGYITVPEGASPSLSLFTSAP